MADTTNTLQQALDWIEERKDQFIPLKNLAPMIAIPARTLVDQGRRSCFPVTREGRVLGVDANTARQLAKQNKARILGWDRLVDVCQQVAIHRNLGESFCRREGFEPSLDLCGHYRISPEAVAYVHHRVRELEERKDWRRKVDFAEDIGEDPRLVDTICRKLGLLIDCDVNGFVILSPEAVTGFENWRNERDRKRERLREIDGEKFYALVATAETASAALAPIGSTEQIRLANRYYRRFLFWTNEDLKYVMIDGGRFFPEEVHNALVDDLTVTEAARMGGVACSTVKHWLANGMVETHYRFGKRRSLSKQQFRSWLTDQYQKSPKLRRRDEWPVWLLPDVESIRKQLHLRDLATLCDALEELLELNSGQIRALRQGLGRVPLIVRDTLNDWSAKADAGDPLSILDAFRTVTIGEVKENLVRLEQERPELPQEEVHRWLAGIAGVTPREFQSRLEPGREEEEIPWFVQEFLGYLLDQQLPVQTYRPETGYRLDDFLVNASSGDYGWVREIMDAFHIRVAWRRSGDLIMSQSGQNTSRGFVSDSAAAL